MCELLKNIWQYLIDNSGPIQIIIALIALFLAYYGYKKILKQIEISMDQTNLMIRQNNHDLKMNALELINRNVENNGEMLYKLPILIEELKEINRKITDVNKKKIIKDNIDKLNSQKESIEETKNTLIRVSKNFTQSSQVKVDNLEEHLNTLYETLISSTHSLSEYNSLVHDINGIKKEEKLI